MAKFTRVPLERHCRSGELARLLQVDDSTVKRWADHGLIGCYRTPGGHRKFTPRQIQDFIRRFHYEVKGAPEDFTTDANVPEL